MRPSGLRSRSMSRSRDGPYRHFMQTPCISNPTFAPLRRQQLTQINCGNLLASQRSAFPLTSCCRSGKRGCHPALTGCRYLLNAAVIVLLGCLPFLSLAPLLPFGILCSLSSLFLAPERLRRSCPSFQRCVLSSRYSTPNLVSPVP